MGVLKFFTTAEETQLETDGPRKMNTYLKSTVEITASPKAVQSKPGFTLQ